MTASIDAVGKPCPMPVVLTKKALDAGEHDLIVHVDNTMAAENLIRLAESMGRTATTTPKGDTTFTVHITGSLGGMPVPPSPPPSSLDADCAVLIAKDFVGDGDLPLGQNLMKMFLYTLAQRDTPPATLLFLNTGVRLPALAESQVLDSLLDLQQRGCRILVCGACLNYFGFSSPLPVGTVSNLYEIVDEMLRVPKTITI